MHVECRKHRSSVSRGEVEVDMYASVPTFFLVPTCAYFLSLNYYFRFSPSTICRFPSKATPVDDFAEVADEKTASNSVTKVFLMSQVLPFGGSTDVNPCFQDLKIVDRSNAYAKFSKRPPSRGTESSIFASAAAVEQSVPRPVSRLAQDPFSRMDEVKPVGVRMTGMEDVQKAREDYNFSHQRIAKRPLHPASASSRPNPGVAFTAYGQSYLGKAVVVHTNQESQPAKDRNERSMERFRLTPRTTSNVLLPQTLEDTTPKPKPQRFQQSNRHGESLVGVLGKPVTDAVARSYKVTAPWSTE